jgi:hypothetical protein
MRAIRQPPYMNSGAPIYWGEKTNLSGPIVGGGRKEPSRTNIMHRLSKAMSGFGVHKKHKSHMRRGHSVKGGCLNYL